MPIILQANDLYFTDYQLNFLFANVYHLSLKKCSSQLSVFKYCKRLTIQFIPEIQFPCLEVADSMLFS